MIVQTYIEHAASSGVLYASDKIADIPLTQGADYGITLHAACATNGPDTLNKWYCSNKEECRHSVGMYILKPPRRSVMIQRKASALGRIIIGMIKCDD
jgi:hypothetical protein